MIEAAPAALLYIHPRGHLNDLVVPAGALSALNAVRGPKLGRYAFEVSDAEIRAARVVVMDLHWALGLGGLVPLLARVRAVNPGAPIVVGGITASHYPAELIESLGVDHVVQGDAETSFAALVAALLEEREPGDLPNVWSRGVRPRLERMTEAAFDETDCLTADWFPTLSKVRDWITAAYPMSATLPLARGCRLRCPTCYGSHADTFGPGLLVRSAGGVAREVERARRLGLRSLRIFAGKLPASTLTTLLAAAASAGPVRLDRGAGIYLCTPPNPRDLDAIEAAFDGHVGITVIPPREHVPRPSPGSLAIEESAWRAVVARAKRSPRLRLDAWTMDGTEMEPARGLLEPDGDRVVVSLGVGWNLTRPVGSLRPEIRALHAAVEPLWTFYAARLLSPALDDLLAPFRLLDELDRDPASSPAPPGPLLAWHEVAQARWREHRLPALPGLTFWALPATLRPGARLGRSAGICRLHGAAHHVAAGGFELLAGSALPLRTVVEDAGVRLRVELTSWPGTTMVALAPAPPDGRLTPGWIEALSARGLLLLESAPEATFLEVTIRVQEAGLALLDAAGQAVRRGRAELGYIRAR